MKRISAFLLLAVAILGSLPLSAQDKLPRNMQDVLYLNNGWIIRGKIIMITQDNLISIETEGRNVFVFQQEEIRSQTREPKKLKRRERYEPIPLDRGYYGTLQLASLSGSSQFSYSGPTTGVTTSHGYRFNQWLAVGGGVGGYDYGQMLILPIFGEVRTVFKSSGASFFSYLRGGYGFPPQPNPGGWGVIQSELGGGLHTEYAVGVRLPTRRKFAWTLGVNMSQQQASEYYEYEWEETINRNFVFRRVGFFLGWELF